MVGYTAAHVVLALCLTLSLSAPVNSSKESSPLLSLQSGTVRGITLENGTGSKFLGIPFAQPPVGDLRWQPPAPLDVWTGVKNATSYGNTCYQHKDFWTIFANASEDCLYTNVWMPPPLPTGSDKKFKVMVFFYGGAWKTGSASFPLYSGKPSMQLHEDTVVVIGNYRLNVFGFLGGDDLRDTLGGTGNFGIQDQRMLLKWVHDNAEALNADLTKVTIWGESAGSGSVSNHLVQEKSFPYFTRAIMESGAAAAHWVSQNITEANGRLKALAVAVGCDGASNIRACLGTKNSSELYVQAMALPSRDFIDWSPVIDGVNLVDQPSTLLRQGKANDVPVLLGVNKNEGSLFLRGLNPNANASEVRDWITTKWGYYRPNRDSFLPQILDRYQCKFFNATAYATNCFWSAAAFLGDYAMDCAARRTARWFTQEGKYSNQVFSYVFETKFVFTDFLEKQLKQPFGVFHGSELGLVFDFEELLWKKEERELARTVVEYWTTFADTGIPRTTSSSAPSEWVHYDANADTIISLDTPEVTEVSGRKKELCDFWDTLEEV